MASSFWIFLTVIIFTAIVSDMIVKIVRAAKSGGGKEGNKRLADLEADLGTIEQDLADARARIEVLERIVTDDKYDLGRQIDDLERRDRTA